MHTTFAEFQRRCVEERPEVALVLGSGLGVIAERIDRLTSLPFAEIPALPTASVHGHRGLLSLGRWGGRAVLLFEGRLHYYEGHPWEVVTRPIRLAAELGVRSAVLTNAAGGIREDLGPGCLMLLRDHLQWNHPHAYRETPRPSPYSERLRGIAGEVARSLGQKLPEGVYAAVTGPCYETPAEIRALRSCGADAVGMSTAREVEAGAESGLEMAAISLITNKGAGLSAGTLNHAEVLEMAKATAERLGDLLAEMVQQI